MIPRHGRQGSADAGANIAAGSNVKYRGTLPSLMNHITVLRKIGVVACCVSLLASTATSQSGSVAIVHATLIDGTGAPARQDVTVTVTAGRIVTVGQSDRTRVPSDAAVVDATGKWLIPGLWDMHFHSHASSNPKETLAQLVASGVTGIRDMASPLDEVLTLRRDTSSGTVVGPRMVVAGPILQGPLPFSLPPLVRATTQNDATKTVDELKAAGVDFIKVGDTLTRDTYFRIAAESKRVGLPFAGHLTPFVSASEAARAGQRSIEHFGSAGFRNVLIAASTDEAPLSTYAQAALDGLRLRRESPDTAMYRAEYANRLVDTYSQTKAQALFALFVKQRTWLVPTFAALDEVWSGQRAKLNPADATAVDRIAQKTSDMFRDARRAGVKVLAGTDLSVRNGVAPLHAELAALVRAGMSEMDALRAATHDSAEFLDALKTRGTIEVGKDADLVLLEGNPLTNIRNTERVSAVMLRGRLFQSSDLKSLATK